MKILEELGIDENSPSLFTIGSSCGVGKTTILSLIASDFVKKGEKVLFISDDNLFSITRRFTNLKTKPTDLHLLSVKSIIDSKQLNKIISNKGYTHIFIDTILLDKNIFYDIRNIIHDEKLRFFTSQQLFRTITIPTPSEFKLKSNQLSDYLCVLRKDFKFSLLDKVKFFFKFKKKPNLSLELIKNRFGDKKILDLYINFNEINNF